MRSGVSSTISCLLHRLPRLVIPSLLLLLDTVASIFLSPYLCPFIDTTGLPSVPVSGLSPSHLHLQLLTPMRPRQRPPSATLRLRLPSALSTCNTALPSLSAFSPLLRAAPFWLTLFSCRGACVIRGRCTLCYPRTLHIVCFVRAEYLFSHTHLAAIRSPCANHTTCPRGWPEVSIGASRLG
jgi:hypothetical protein